ncbi:metallophosphoesterase family protein [Deinococcus humi]|uniref:Uncharacterized protein n=1 Tax=Deinococcus humi TaxID=662880 RepID=A0A7W8JZH6_9DEIO|nr:hypothetical protein [Deinococcus humi]MBB5366080.1 hypothetical protein [Deinococcus humi]GGO40065.1 hypothetical protein GCM10008949_49060 [Deinococcus humi]
MRAVGVVIVEHSHLEHLRQIGPLVVNAGAVSRQKDGSPSARWVLLEGKRGTWSVSFRPVSYEVDAAPGRTDTPQGARRKPHNYGMKGPERD